VLDLGRADRGYVRDSLDDPPFLREFWPPMIEAMMARKDQTPE
jgi:hypothetical protein